MTSTVMSDLPYSTAVLRLAAEAHGAGRLTPPCHSHTARNPVCGDATTFDLHLDGQTVMAVAHDTKACVLTQAAASILGETLTGHSAEDIKTLREAVAGRLQGGTAPEGDFQKFAVLADVARHPARHRCVLLPIEAALKAAEETSQGA